MSDFLYLISEEGLPTFLVVTFLIGIGFVARWFATYFASRMDNQFSEILREVTEMHQSITEHNNKVYGVMEKLISNQRLIGEDINALESSLDTLLKFIKADK